MEHFSEDEARRIFAEAARATPAEAPDRSLSLAELQEIGRAAGLDPAAVAAAAAGLRDAVPDVPMWGATPLAIRRSRIVPGTLSDDAWAEAVAGLRRTFKTQGVAETLGRTRTWTHAVGSSSTMIRTRITAEGADGVTRLTAESDMGRGEKLGAQVVLGIMSVFSVAAAALTLGTGKPEGLLVAGLLFMLTLVIYATIRFSAVHRARTLPRQFDISLDQIAPLVSTVAPAEAPAAPLRDAFDASADADLEPSAAPRRRDRA